MQCNYPCTGIPNVRCGGAWANSVYTTAEDTPPVASPIEIMPTSMYTSAPSEAFSSTSMDPSETSRSQSEYGIASRTRGESEVHNHGTTTEEADFGSPTRRRRLGLDRSLDNFPPKRPLVGSNGVRRWRADDNGGGIDLRDMQGVDFGVTGHPDGDEGDGMGVDVENISRLEVAPAAFGARGRDFVGESQKLQTKNEDQKRRENNSRLGLSAEVGGNGDGARLLAETNLPVEVSLKNRRRYSGNIFVGFIIVKPVCTDHRRKGLQILAKRLSSSIVLCSSLPVVRR